MESTYCFNESMRYPYPWLFAIEENYDYKAAIAFGTKRMGALPYHWFLIILFSAFYSLGIYYGQRVMASRVAFELRRPLIGWNLLLAVFSVLGTIRFAPEFLWSLQRQGFIFSVCNCTYRYSAAGLWADLFAASKVLEFGDTAFLVLRKRPVRFLHWYHHISTLMFCWDAMMMNTGVGRWYIIMNYTVHSMMYSYYAARAMGLWFPKFVPMTITVLQILQMVGGLVVTLAAFLVKSKGAQCDFNDLNIRFGLAMYASYLWLFAQFFYESYFLTKRYDIRPNEQKGKALLKKNEQKCR